MPLRSPQVSVNDGQMQALRLSGARSRSTWWPLLRGSRRDRTSQSCLHRTAGRSTPRRDQLKDHRFPACARVRRRTHRCGHNRHPCCSGDQRRSRVELAEVRLELAAALGATVFRPDELTIPDHPGETPEPGYHIVYESSGARSASETGLTQLVGGGTLVIVGTGLDFPRLDTNRVILNELHITGAFNYDADGFGAALDLIASGTLPLDLLIHPETVGLEGMLDAMTQLRSGEIAGKVLVTP